MIDVDIIQRVKVAGIFTLQVYKVLTGTLLSLFIPQSCGEQICTLKENLEDSDPYHQKVLAWNILTGTLFIFYYLIELRREEWSIKYLDIDNDKPDNSLKEIIAKYPKLDSKMDRLNKYYYNTLLLTCFFYTINMGISAKLVKDKYHSMSTVSCFFSFSLLVLMKLYNSLVVARQSVKNDKMMSAYMNEFVSYNVIDSDYLEKIQKENQKGNQKITNKP
tara:strand:- start:161 stop:817 length:657 start_codon:yes stop_codon:yes gene_type:complete